MPAGHWHRVVPIAGPLTPGAAFSVPLFEPMVGPVDLVSVLADGTERRARVTNSPPPTAARRVE
ncbi:MAG: hypothetical protein JNM10_16050 [Planctomycetia bacterium]|nr:hypothetical protein [Planctomycetia bacterium]